MSIRSASARSSTDAVVLESTVVSDDSGGARVREARPARLVVVTGSSAGSAIPLGNDETTVGRAPTNEVVLPDISVSRRHALLRREPDGYVLIDQGSGNGTRLNGRSVQVTRLCNGDEVTLGDAVVQFVEAGRVILFVEKLGELAIGRDDAVADRSRSLFVQPFLVGG